MQLLVLILNRHEHLLDILEEFKAIGIKGATIIDSIGMGRTLKSGHNHHAPLIAGLMRALEAKHPENKTIISVVEDEQVDKALDAIESIVGDLSEPGRGICFTIPVLTVRGLARNGFNEQEWDSIL